MSKMKKFMSTVTALTLTAISAVSMVASATDNSHLYWNRETKDVGIYTVGFFSNSLTGEEYCVIESCNDNTLTELVIPDEIDGIKVKQIYAGAFKDFDNLVSIDFGNYKSLCGSMFEDCDALVEVTLPEWLSSIPESMFKECSNLKKIEMTSEDCGSIGAYAFYNCTSLETVILSNNGNPDGTMKMIGLNSFYNCDSLESIALPIRVDWYGNAFIECDNLKSVTVNGVEVEFKTEAEITTQATSTTTETTTVETQAIGIKPTLIGDANCDGIVTVSDALVLAEYVATAGELDLTEQAMVNADVHETGNGLNASDAYMIQQYATGVIESL